MEVFGYGVQIDTVKSGSAIVNVRHHEYSITDNGTGVFRSNPVTSVYLSERRVVFDRELPEPLVAGCEKTKYKGFKRIVQNKMQSPK